MHATSKEGVLVDNSDSSAIPLFAESIEDSYVCASNSISLVQRVKLRQAFIVKHALRASSATLTN